MNNTINQLNNQPEPLKIETLPLTGVSLIEASAGTGKTYTISSIYVRLVLGHKCSALSPESILVVTFTRAATEELRDRIRKRLKQVLQNFESEQASDDFVQMLFDELPDHKVAIQTLKDALQLMDLAAIYTIHGFANKLLQQHVIESQVSGEFELVLDESELLLKATQDVWRQQVYPLQGEALNLILNEWSGPEALMYDVRPLLYKDLDFYVGDQTNQDDFNKASESYWNAHGMLANLWQAKGASFVEEIENHPKANGTYKKTLLKRQSLMERYLNSDTIKIKDADLDKALQSFTHFGLQKSVKKGGEPVNNSISDAVQNLLDYKAVYDKAKALQVRLQRIQFIQSISERLSILKQQQNCLSTDDLLGRLNESLNTSVSGDGEKNELLINSIRQLYPVALVDEFQDTDAKQYAVFHDLYVAKDKGFEGLGLFMIGDPKQAIYKFRGADIFTYIQAKNQVDNAYTLDTNYRSTGAMVDGVNTLFSQHNRSFIYDDNIPFIPVKAHDKASELWQSKKLNSQQGHVSPAIICITLNTQKQDISTKAQLSEHMAQSCAEQISQLLLDAQNGSCQLGRHDEKRLLEAKDMAVLVRDRNQAKLIKDALNERQIACVYVGQDSIFDSVEAQALLMLLHAIHDISEKRFRNAIAHPIWQLSLSELQQTLQDENAWEHELEQLYVCHDIWHKQGIMAMVMHWIHGRDLAKSWLQLINGERCLTNILHLAEMLQQSSSELQGMQGLLSWFDRQVTMALNSDNAEQKQLRLESDANLVQIITIHKSKGLEYPVVFLPFVWDGKLSKDEVFYDLETNTLHCDMVGDYQAQRLQEGLAEEVRLLYVALTRAVSKCYLSLPDMADNKKLLSSFGNSAVYHILFNALEQDQTTEQADIIDIANVLQELEDKHPNSFKVEPALETITLQSRSTEAQSLSVRQFNKTIKRDWQLTSFSSMVRHHHVPHTSRFNLDDELQPSEPAKEMAAEVTEVIPSPFSFPRGAHAGNFLHTLFEEVDFQNLPDDLDQLIESLLARFAIEESWLPLVKTWLPDMLNTPLMPKLHADLALCQLSEEDKQVEMEFYFPIHRLQAKEFNELFEQYAVLDCPVQAVEFETIKGMLKGFIDLTFCWNDQYFILDYKSNHLGDEVSDYQEPRLHLAMADHRYDVQLVLYTLALHRLLSLRIANYDYDEHIGGGYYLFLRGLNQQGTEGQFFHKPEKALIYALDELITESQHAA